jgi:hypothetical protein
MLGTFYNELMQIMFKRIFNIAFSDNLYFLADN